LHGFTLSLTVDSDSPGGHEELVALDKALTGLIAQRSVDKVGYAITKYLQ